ncbi:zinc finger, C3HC4 type (RING finger) protein (macronuclear) [Tetrahymena thermophila SB210]|uniref:Zinc finger, C3HC4 type (RING finger) protein n=1 Tax=Tetrahymena thermophila (strain SB210) TaxID=312017 RepID=Q22ZB2_TETTS|nr:zinc finger, C3HC4 type (RING finger) protein [Tetrahymena thermophila SB210]EAR90409.2 zinc finger, C3HC4 type (RING finger) protein [Tetrahymena thermophila SB210]|eukprot:XP_001010654.2 zinc finger, C3HC4 type (RING finger) protein [Tetrahymena thermophila SB210]
MKVDISKIITLFQLVICILDLIICQEEHDQPIKRDQVAKIFSLHNTLLDLHFGQQVIVPLNFQNTKYSIQKNQENGILIDELEFVLVEVKVDSNNLYQVYYREVGSFEQEQFQSIDGVHFFKFINLKNRTIEIVLRNIEYEIQYQSFLSKKIDFHNVNSIIQFQVEVISLQQVVCPFDCFGNGSCQQNGQCLCQEGYSQQFYCQTQIKDQAVQFDIQTRIFDQTQTNEIELIMNEDWVFQTINVLFDQYIQNQIESSISSHMKPLSVSIIIEYQKQDQSPNHKLILLDMNTSFRILQKEKTLGNRFITTIDVLYQDFQAKSLSNNKNSYPFIIGHKGCKSIDLVVKFNYLSQAGISEIFTLTFVIIFSVIFVYIFALILRRRKPSFFSQDIQSIMQMNLDQSEIQLNIEQINQQIQSQMPTFLYTLPTNNNLNGTHYECFICLNKYQDLDECRMTKCGHVFHKNCVDAWLQKSLVCPVDRVNLQVKC